MPKKSGLLVQHLEDVSWNVLDEYRGVVQEMIRGKAGVYALYRREKLYYIGLARNLMGRLRQHMQDRHNGRWDRFSVYLTGSSEHMKELESLMLRIVDPPGNKVKGKFSRSEDLRRTLNKNIRAKDDERRAGLLGGLVAKRWRRGQVTKAGRVVPLSAVSDKRRKLFGSKAGWEYHATLLKNGTIKFAGKTYETPTAAARAAVKGRANGWNFWRYRDSNGEWVRLKMLKKGHK